MTNSELKEQIRQDLELTSQPEPERRPHRWVSLLVIVAVVAGILIIGIRSRVKAESSLRDTTAEMALPSVSVVTPKKSATAEEIILPGNIQPLIASPIYARTDGYLRKWYFDIGAHVKKGQLLAVIETPEVDQQLQQARSNLATAQANLELARITKDRYESLLKKHAVAQQDADNAAASFQANQTIVDADNANVQRFETLVSFEKVYAPFDGVITARNTDIGDLINAGSSTAARTDLFQISQTGTLRVYVNVPQEYAQSIKPGITQADIVLPELPDRRFPGKLVRTSEAINQTTRTLLAEVDIDNPDGQLLTGSYAEVHLKVPNTVSTFLVPSNCLIFRAQGLQLGLVRDNKVVLTNVTTGHDLGTEVEVVTGLKADDHVIVNPSDSIVSGQQVQIVDASLPGDVK
jgi:RND family efflux transporter MFP subunit